MRPAAAMSMVPRALLRRDAGVDGGRREGWHERMRPAAAMSMSPCEMRQFIVLCARCHPKIFFRDRRGFQDFFVSPNRGNALWI